MADFVAVLKKTLDGLSEATPALRQKVYDKARATIDAKLAAINPPPPQAVVDRQKRALEDAIATIEKDYSDHARPKISDDPLQELEGVFASIERQKSAPQKPVEPARAESAPKAEIAPKADQMAKPAPAPSTDAAPAPRSNAWPKTTPAAPSPSAAQTAPAAPAKSDVLATADDDDDDDDDDDNYTADATDAVETEETPDKRRKLVLMAAAAVAFVVIAGGSYGIWGNRQASTDLPGQQDAAATAPATKLEPAPATETKAAAAPEPAPAGTDTEPKFTQRLNADGSEIDPGPAGGTAAIGEGTSVAAATQPSLAPTPANAAVPADPATGTPATGQTPAAQPGIAVGQRAIFYEERTNVAQGSAESGSIVWSVVQESPGGELPPEPAIRAEATIPGKDLQLRMTIRRNADGTLPASHIIEVIFLTPEGFEGGGIENVLRVSMKGSEQEAGSPLIGIPAKIADGFFLIALNDGKPEVDANMTLLRRQSWIDVPVIYKSGRRALFTMEKGIPGQKVFDEAMKAWQAATGNSNG